MINLRKWTALPGVNIPYLVNQIKLHLHFQYARVLIGVMCLIFLIAMLLALPAESSHAQPYLQYSDLPVQPYSILVTGK